ncbi:MAG: replication-associated recombination protein A [candidate division Zixibacteria bacterium]|nr:replication-associated recombination protein A [candidate division Zixibacteria bacterium]
MDFFEDENSKTKSFRSDSIKPLADRMRPQTFNELIGQEAVVGETTPLRMAIEQDKVPSIIFWGPTGSGKTTLAELIAKSTHGQFVNFSAVTSGIKEVKDVLTKAAGYYQMSGRRTYIFVDEIHRFNKAQQDAFLPYVEHGDVILIGATTENPSFEVNSALLSRMRVYVLTRISEEALKQIMLNALSNTERGLGKKELSLAPDALEYLAAASDGDARRGLSLLEATAAFVGERKTITLDDLRQVNQRGTFLYDKSGEEHFNLISALHKTIRGGDPDAALYWLTRMLESGEEPMYVIRRLVRFATEDIGLADPYALTLALNARDSFHFLGSPEGELAIAQLVIYMACAPKSNAVYTAFKQSKKDVEQHGSLPVPLEIRNAPTRLMKGLGYGAGYQYAHDYKEALTTQQYFPKELGERRYYQPTNGGDEKRIAEYLEKFHAFRKGLVAEKNTAEKKSSISDQTKKS